MTGDDGKLVPQVADGLSDDFHYEPMEEMAANEEQAKQLEMMEGSKERGQGNDEEQDSGKQGDKSMGNGKQVESCPGKGMTVMEKSAGGKMRKMGTQTDGKDVLPDKGGQKSCENSARDKEVRNSNQKLGSGTGKEGDPIVDPVAARSKAAAVLAKQKLLEEERCKKTKKGKGGKKDPVVINLGDVTSNNEKRDNDDDVSENTPPKDNGTVGRDNARKGQTSFQAMEGVELPIFWEIHPR
jgi:hypothetical protein